MSEADRLLSDEALEEINRVWTVARIFSSTAHDVNNALQVISGSAELLEARGDLDPTTLRRVQAIRSQTARATESIDRLLTYSRHSGGSAQTIDLDPIIDAAIAMRSFTFKRASIAIDRSRSDTDPYRAAAVDPRAILQLLLTLLLFFERTLATGGPARLTVALDREPSLVVVSLVGEMGGAGGFHAGDGSGAGDPLAASQLMAVRRLAERQRGTLTVDSDGSTLKAAKLTLPSS